MIELSAKDYAFWYYGQQRMVELLADPAHEAMWPVFEKKKANFERMMAEYRQSHPEPSMDEIVAHRPIISTPQEIQEGLTRQIDALRKAEGL